MNGLTFTWDTEKAHKNARKHGISFEEAITVFADERARLIHDPDHSEQEERFILMGLSAKLRVLVIAHTYRSKDNEIRLISARKATKNEQNEYGSFQ